MNLSFLSKHLVRILLLVAISTAIAACGDRGGSDEDDGGGATNTPPEADAGVPQVVAPDALVTLDASASTDADGDTLSFTWEQTSGTAVTLDAATFATTTFTAPAVSGVSENLTFRVRVSDGTATSRADVTILVQNDSTTTLPPIAAAGADQTVNANDTVILDGSTSLDPRDLPLTYTWTQIAGSPVVTLSAADTAAATFTAPSLPRNTPLTFSLTVSNGFFNDIDTVVITVNSDPDTLTPTANAGRNQTVTSGDAVTLDGTGSSDPRDLELTYSWEQIGGDTVALVGADQSIATFTAPAVSAETLLVFTLTVSNGEFENANNVQVTVNPTPDATAPAIVSQSPAPDATAVSRSTTVTVGFDEAILEASIDSDTFMLRQGDNIVGGTFEPYDATENELTFTPAGNLLGNRVYTVLIEGITDLAGNPVEPTEWNFTTSASAGPTVEVANPDQFVGRGSLVTLDASGSTDDLTDDLQYQWTQTAGSPVTLSSPTAASPSFATAALDIETLIFTVTVTDSDGIPNSSTSGNVYVTLLEDAANALFVSTAGADGNTGTRTAPFRTISRAVNAASGVSPRPDIYVTEGSYTELATLGIISDVSIYGSYDGSFHRVLDADSDGDVDANVVPETVINGTNTALIAADITAPTYIDLVDIRAAAATSAGANSVGLTVTNSVSPELVVSRSSISAGNGDDGVDGAPGDNGDEGRNGEDGASGAGSGDGNGGSASASLCGLDVGDSGAGGNGGLNSPGEDGLDSASDVPGGAGGTGSNDGEPGGAASGVLPAGDPGAVGSASGSIAGSSWQPDFGQDGIDGSDGGASGGGGGGGASDNDNRGGGGGSGGTGGCPGTGGTAGQGGFGSFAVLLSNSAIDIQDASLSTGDGGNGGDGGAGGNGGAGGIGGTGGSGQGGAGDGGTGGAGQAGSAGGAGGVGAGGPSIGIVALSGSTLPSTTGTTITLGYPGSAGQPAAGGLSGEEGLRQDTLVLDE